MAEETGYNRRVGPQAAAPSPMAPNFGEAIGQAVQRAGVTLHQQGLENYALARRATKQEESARFQRGFVDVREAIGAVSRDERMNGGPGHAARVREAYNANRDTLLGSITEDDVRDRASEMFDEFGSRVFEQEAQFEEARRVQSTLTNWSETEDLSNNRIRRLDNHEDYLTELEIRHQAVDGLDIAQSDKDKAHREVDQSGSIAFLRGRIDADPALAHTMLDQGLFDDVLTPQQLDGLRNEAGIGVRQLAVQAQRQEAERAAMVREEAATLLERHSQGIEIAPDAFAPLIEQARAAGDTSLAEKLSGAQADNVFARVYKDATPLALEQRLNSLANKDKPSEAEQRELGWLGRTIDSRRSDFDRDPTAFLMETGGAPPVDFADGASLEARAQWARAQSRATGRHVPILTRNEAAPLADTRASGGDTAVLAALDRFTSPLDRVDAAQVIDPEDKVFHRLAAMPPQYRATMQAGAKALAANPQLLKPLQQTSRGSQALKNWEQQLAVALREIDPEDAAAVRDVARMEIAGRLSAHPGETIDTQGASLFSRGMNRALGAEVRGGVQYGGLGIFNGGHPFVLPDGISREQWQNGVAADRTRKRQAGAGPVNPDGSTFDLNRAHPVWLGGNAYRWETDSGAGVRAADGRPYTTEIGGR